MQGYINIKGKCQLNICFGQLSFETIFSKIRSARKKMVDEQRSGWTVGLGKHLGGKIGSETGSWEGLRCIRD